MIIVRSLSALRHRLSSAVLAPAVIAAATLTFVAGEPNARADGGKVAVVDIQRAVMQTEDGLRAAANLKKVFDAKQVELNKRQEDLRRQQEDIQKQERVLSKEALAKKKDEWQRQAMELQSVFVDYNKQLEGEQKKATDPIFAKMLDVVRRIAGQEGYDVVLEKNSTAYARTELDLTDRCIQGYNSGANAPAPASTSRPATAPSAAPRK
jgi:outer membrane protein